MRTEKTEFGHIDEIIRRIALARFDVTINLSHNGKVMRQYRAVAEGGQKERRLGAICGTPFLEQALAIEWQHGDFLGAHKLTAGGSVVEKIQYFERRANRMRRRFNRDVHIAPFGIGLPGFLLFGRSGG